MRRTAEVRRRRTMLEPVDLTRLRELGTVPARLSGFLDGAASEATALCNALGGPEEVSPQRRALIEDTARLGLVLRALLASFVQGGGLDGELASRVATLAGARRANLAAIGLDERRVERDLASYLRERAQPAPQDRAGATIDVQPEPTGAGR